MFSPTSFNPKAQDFSIENAWVLSRIAELAYQTGFDVEYDAQNVWKMAYSYLENEASDTQFLVMGDAEKVFVAFRGTESNLEDWTTNTRYHLVPALGGKVHDGFWASAQSIMGTLATTLDVFCDKGQTVWLTGHSLGGALAMLVTAYFVEQGIQPAGLYTFGQPRVGNSEFAYQFNTQYAKAYRILNEDDVVGCVPPASLSYEHAGKYYGMPKTGNFSHDLEAWQRAWASEAKVIDEFLELAVFGLKAHEIAAYRERLESK